MEVVTQISFWLQALISVLSGVVVLIPLVYELIKFVKKAAKEKNWSQLLKIIMGLMADAEQRFEDGSSRKDWVIGQLKAISKTLNYDIDWNVVSEMIDQICAASKEINV